MQIINDDLDQSINFDTNDNENEQFEEMTPQPLPILLEKT
jgi:hypothetical protein